MAPKKTKGIASKIASRMKTYLRILVLLLVGAAFVRFSPPARAASMYLTPNSKTVNVGQTFSMSIIVSTPEDAMNASSGKITFPTDKLEILDVSKGGSVINLWVREPSFSNAEGSLSFEGIVLNPGFLGSSGKILSFTVKAKSQGTASVHFASGSMLANDGQGSAISASLGSSNITINVPTAAPLVTKPAGPTPTPTPKEEPQPDMVVKKLGSSSHPDQDAWYPNLNVKLSWELPNGATGMSVALDKNANTTPPDKNDKPTTAYEANSVGNGIWYFHIKVRNQKGWGPVSHYRFQMDAEKPQPVSLLLKERPDSTEPKIKIGVTSSDSISGISFYEIQIDTAAPQRWQDNAEHVYESAAQLPGDHVFLVKAFDKSGNFSSDFVKVKIDTIAAPKDISMPLEVENGQDFVLSGTALPNSQVIVFLQRNSDEPKSYKTIADANGNFTITIKEKLQAGEYNVWQSR